jgi:DNA-binding NarL/FixJ family response regulator
MDSFSSLAPRRSGAGDNVGAGRAGGGTSAATPLRVFLVEDSPSVRDRLIDFLAEPGRVDVIGFADTETEAVRQLWSEPVDVAIVDLNLREGTGMGVIESLRALQSVPRPTVVVLTNYAFPEFEVACRERGADYFFDKSTQFGALKVLLQSIQRQRN